jgi:hypothetical protein
MFLLYFRPQFNYDFSMNEVLMPDWMRNIKDEQVSGSLKEAMEKQGTVLGTALIHSEALNTWHEFVRELATQVELCPKLGGIGSASLVPVGEGENAKKEFRITICGSGPLAAAKICVVRFCQFDAFDPYILCICQDGLRDDFRIMFRVDGNGKVRLLTDNIATPLQAASYVMEPIVRSFAKGVRLL